MGEQMNNFLSNLFDVIALDTVYLNTYLSKTELQYLCENIASREDFEDNFYTADNGENLEVLLQFLSAHKNEIIQILDCPTKKSILIDLYTSIIITGEYNCFRFDLDKFEQTYEPRGEVKTIYRVGRENENTGSLGNSWSTSHSGVKSYADASSICAISRPVFEATINDSEILSEVNSSEDELILKKGFIVNDCRELSDEEKHAIFE